jgi:nucleolar protein 9
MIDQRLFIQNAYAEVDGKELTIACDYEGSRILEKLMGASNDFQLRVFADRLNGR